MQHYFNIDIASDVGIIPAILFENIQHWIEHNRANEKHFSDGEYWTFNSMRAFGELFPYMTKKQIELALKKLKEDGYIKTGNYNQMKYDRTMWYALGEKGKCISRTEEMECTKKEKCISRTEEMDVPQEGNGCPAEGTPIPIINHYKNNNIYMGKKSKQSFVVPTVDEVKQYCDERHNMIDPNAFIDFYSSKGWMVGKSQMKDWKAAIRTWERNNKPQCNHESNNGNGGKKENTTVLPSGEVIVWQ